MKEEDFVNENVRYVYITSKIIQTFNGLCFMLAIKVLECK